MLSSHVFDTYARTINGRIMHFDVVIDAKDVITALKSAKLWLKSIGEDEATVAQENCVFCHSTEVSADFRKQIDDQGYAIYKLEGCPK